MFKQQPVSSREPRRALSGLSRRGFLRQVGSGALAVSALPLLSAACGPAPSAPANPPTVAPAPPTAVTAPATVAAAKPATQPTTVAAPAAKPTTVAPPSTTSAGGLPSYIPLATKPTPDLPSKGPLFEDAYLAYPANPTKALPGDLPGLGSSITAVVIGLYPPATPSDQNPAWQAVNKALNVNFQFNVIPLADFPAKLGAIMASGSDLPDIIGFFSSSTTLVPNVPAFLQHSTADLTPYLAGDAIKDYPNLAAIPTFAWKNSGSVLGGRIVTVPLERPAPGLGQLFKNSQLYDTTIGKDVTPKNADDFKRVLQALTQPSNNVWGFAGYQGSAYLLSYFIQMFGAPNNWTLDSSGKLVKDVEAPQYKEAVGYVRDLVNAGVMHPDSPTIASQTAYRDAFVAGKFATAVQAFGNNWFDVWSRGQKADPKVDFLMINPIAAHDGAAPVTHLGGGFNSAAALKPGSPERIKEVLRVMNWLAAPFGSQEDLLLTNGLAGTHYNLDASGNPVSTPAWGPDVNNVPWRYVVQHPQVIYYPGAPDFIRAEYNAEQVLLPVGLSDPTLGYYSPTANAKGVQLTQALLDGFGDIVAARRPLSDYDQLVKDWQSGGGEQMRQEYQQEIAAAA